MTERRTLLPKTEQMYQDALQYERLGRLQTAARLAVEAALYEWPAECWPEVRSSQ